MIKDPKTKMYFTVGLIMIIIITAWILNLKNSLQLEKNKQSEKNQELTQIADNFSNLLVDVKNMKNQVIQSATTTAESLQGGPQISPDQLESIAERLKTETSTSTATSTATTTKE